MLHPAWNAGCSNAPMIIRLTASPRVPIVVSHHNPLLMENVNVDTHAYISLGTTFDSMMVLSTKPDI